MKRFKIAILISLLIGVLGLAVACQNGGTLSAPKEVDYNIENELSWSPVENARGYYVQIINVATGKDEGDKVRRTTTKISLSFLAEGDYEIRVMALDKDEKLDNTWSEKIYFQKGYETGCVYTLINNDTEYRLSRYGSAPATIYIEDEYRGKPVTEIGPRAFKGYSIIENVVVGDNVRVISENAFYGCKELKTIEFGDSLTKVAASAFQACSLLETVTFTESVTEIGGLAFGYCRMLNNVALPNNLQVLGDNAFLGCTSLEKIVLPDSLQTIGYTVFKDNTSLVSAELGDGLVQLPAATFNGCTSLKTIVFSAEETLKAIGSKAFYNCVNLEEVVIPDGVEVIASEAFAMAVTASEMQDSAGKTYIVYDSASKLTAITLPNTVTSVGKNAFYGTKWYMDAMMDEATLTVKDTAEDATSATKDVSVNVLTKEESFLSISGWVIGATNALKEKLEEISADTFGEEIYGIADNAFMGCAKLDEIMLPDNIRFIGAAAFQALKVLTRFEMSEDSQLEHVGQYAFANCLILQYVVLGPNVTIIDDGAFGGCARLDNIDDNVLTPKSVTKVGKDAFAYTKLASKERILKDTPVYYAGNWMVGYDEEAKASTMTLRKGTVGISNYAFGNASDLKTLKFENASDLKYIGYGAFYKCSQLDQVDLSYTSVKRIEDFAFFGCNSMSRISLPTRLESIGQAAFYTCWQMTSIDLSSTRVKEIGQSAFGGCRNLLEVDLGEYLEYIGPGAFYSCVSLKYVSIPSTVTIIADYAFCDCIGLEEISLGENVMVIGNYAFTYCVALKEITLPSSVKAIGEYAFYTCLELQTIHLNEGLESIGAYAFMEDEKLVNVKLPSTLKYIGDYAFAYNKELDVVFLGEALEYTGEHIFYGDNKLTIYVAHTSIPAGWGKDWNSSFHPVVWGYTVTEEDGEYIAYIVVTETSIENAWDADGFVAPTRDGYKFIGWATSPNGDVAYSMEDFMTAPTGTILYAKWQQVSNDEKM